MKPINNSGREVKKAAPLKQRGVPKQTGSLSDKKVGLSRRLSDKAVGKSGDVIRKMLSQAMKKTKPQIQTLKMQEMM